MTSESDKDITGIGCFIALLAVALGIGALATIDHLFSPSEVDLMRACSEACGGQMATWDRFDHSCECRAIRGNDE